MTDCSPSPSPSDRRESGGRRPAIFLSHTRTKRASNNRPCAIGTHSEHPFSDDQVPAVFQGWESFSPRRRSLAVSSAMVQRGDANTDNRTDGQRAPHQQREEASGSSSSSSCASSENVVATIRRERASPRGRASRSSGPSVRDTSSVHDEKPDGDFTLRSSMQKTRASNDESAPFDLVGAVLCGPSESPISSISSHRCSGRSSAGKQELFDSWLRKTTKIRTLVVGKHGIERVPMVSKSLIELAKVRREREATEVSESESESESDSDSDSMSSLSARGNENDGHDGEWGDATKGVTGMSASRNGLSVNPRVPFRSPAEPRSDTTPALPTKKNENDSRGGAGKETTGRVRMKPFSTSPLGASLTPRVTFTAPQSAVSLSPRVKSSAVKRGGALAPNPRVSEKTPERSFGVGKRDIRKPGGWRGVSRGGSALDPMKGAPSVSPAAVEPKTRRNFARIPTTSVSSTGENGGDNGADSSEGSSDTAAQISKNGRSGGGSTISRTNDTRRESAADSLASSVSPTTSTKPMHQEARTGGASSMTAVSDMGAPLNAVEGTARGESARVAFLPKEETAPRSAREKSLFARLHPEVAHSSESKQEPQEVKLPEVCGSGQDTVRSGTKPTEKQVCTLAVIGEGGTPCMLQDTMAIRRKSNADMMNQVSPFKAQLQTSGGAAEASDESVCITSGSIVEKRCPTGQPTGHEDSEERPLEAILGALDGEPHQTSNSEKKSGNQKGICHQQCGLAKGDEKEEEMGGNEGNRSDEKATAVSPALSADESIRTEHPGRDGHCCGETKQTALPNTERIMEEEESRSQARPPAHPVAGSQQREATPVTNTEQEFPRSTRTADRSNCAKIPADLLLDSARQQQLADPPAPNAAVPSPVEVQLSVGGGDSDSGGDENSPVIFSGETRHETHRDASSGKSTREAGSTAAVRPETPLTTRADGTREQRRVVVLAEATSTLGNGGNTIRSAAISSAGLPCSGDGAVSCTHKRRSGKMEVASTDWKRKSVVGDPTFVQNIPETARQTWSGGNKGELLTAPSVKQARKEGQNEADGSTWTQEKSVASYVRPREAAGTAVVKDALSTSSQAEKSLTIANLGIAKERWSIPLADSMGKRVTGGVDRALSASRLLDLPSTAPSSVARDRWLLRVLVEAWVTLACCGGLGRSAAVSLETRRRNTVSGVLPSVEGGGSCGNEFLETDRRGRDGGGGRCSASSGGGKRLPLLIVQTRRSSTGCRKRLSLPIAQARSSDGCIAASVHRTAGGPALSELPIIDGVGSCLVGGSAPTLVVSHGRTMRVRDGVGGSPGPVKNTDDTHRPSQGSLQRWPREENTQEGRNVLVPIRPPGRTRQLDDMSACVSRASLAVEKNLAAGGARRGNEAVPFGFHGHIVVSPAYWTDDGDDGDSFGRGLVTVGSRRRLSSPFPQRRSTESTVEGAPRRSTCPWWFPSPPQLPIVVDTGSQELDG